MTRPLLKKIIKKQILTNCEEKVGNRGTAQKTIHRAVVLQQNHKIIKLCENYNFLAAEAKYVDEKKYINAENDGFEKLFKYIRTEIIAKAQLTTLMQLTRGVIESIIQITIHRAVVLQQNHKIIKLCENYNFLAAEAKYVDEKKYINAENDGFEKLFKYIRTEIIAKAQLTTLMQLTRGVIESIIQTGLQINTSTKKNLGRKIEIQFSTSLEMF